MTLKRFFSIAIISTFAALLVRLLIYMDLGKVALLYLAMPLVMSIAVYWTNDVSERRKARVHMEEAWVVFFTTSAVLFEGFICFVFAAPIYFLVVYAIFLSCRALDIERSNTPSKIKASIVPLVVAVLSLEGVHATTTIDRENQATFSAVVPAGIAQLKENMARPIDFAEPRHWFLTVFPKPTKVEAGSLASGDIHKLEFVYKKWFITNVKKGRIDLKIEDVGDDFVRTRVVRNDSYLASYMDIEGTFIQFTELDTGKTRIDLTIYYQRRLDPVWYFGPLQYFAVSKSAEYFIKSVIAREAYHG